MNEDKLQEIWDFCDEGIRRIMEDVSEGCEYHAFNQGEVLVYKQIQMKINNRCTNTSQFVTYDNVY
jgi:hypothetical protein